MAAAVSTPHEGEIAMRQQLKAPMDMDPTAPGLPMPYAMRVMQSPLVALGTLDEQGRPWSTIWGGERGFAGPVAQNVLGFNSQVDTKHDPVFEALWQGAGPDGVVQPNGGQGKMMSALSIDLETRDRVKLAGVMVAGSAAKSGDVQAAMVVTGSLGNCPKYLNKKDVTPRSPDNAELVCNSLPLRYDALDLVHQADMFFVSSTNGPTMDTNHRGGPSGFVRVVKNDKDGVELVYPEYSGNRLYQTLGNLKVNPLIGVVIPDYDTADVLYLTGTASILVGEEASAVLARTRLAVKITVSAARFVKGGLPFQGSKGEFSPYNPPPRLLLSEKADPRAGIDESAKAELTATLVARDELSPTISRFTFKLGSARGSLEVPKWQAGQHVTLDFEPELGFGYAHMRDDDPQSINDDFVRTFTVSSTPDWQNGQQLQITARRNGAATGLLWKHNFRVELEIPVLGFGGEEKFRLPVKRSEGKAGPVFIAGGVGITPVLAQAKTVLDAGVDLKLLWSVRGEDLPLAVDTFKNIPGLAAVTTLYVTGEAADVHDIKELRVQAVTTKRIGEDDIKSLKGHGRRFFLCAGSGLLQRLTSWLGEEDVVWEDFGY